MTPQLTPPPLQCEFIDLVAAAGLDPSSAAAAAILVIRNGASVSSPSSGADALLVEQLQLQWDTRALMRGRVVNKRARYNVCYGEVAQEPHYEAGSCYLQKFLLCLEDQHCPFSPSS